MLRNLTDVKSEVDDLFGSSAMADNVIIEKIVKTADFLSTLSSKLLFINGVGELADIITICVNIMRLQYVIDEGVNVPISHLSKESIYSIALAKQHILTCPPKRHPFKSASSITTHPVKNDERVICDENLLLLSEFIENDGYGITSDDAREVRRLTFSGNAADLKGRFLLLLEFYFDGEFTSFVKLCLQKHPAMKTALSIVEFSDEEIESIFSELIENLGQLKTIVGKQIYYPSDFTETGYQYTLISPVMSVRMQREISEKLSGFVKKDPENFYWLKGIKSKIGGAQPQNCSYLNSALKGVNYMLPFSIPNTDPFTKVESRLVKGESLLDNNEKIKGVLLSGDVHFQAKGKFTSAVFEWCLSAISLLDDYYADFPEFTNKNLVPADELEYKVATKQELTRDEANEFSRKLLTLISNRIVKDGGEITPVLKKELSASVDRFVREFV